LEHEGIDGRITIKLIFWKSDERGNSWIDLTQDKKKWRDFVYAVMGNEF
jgi:hypothetical protein